MPHIARVGKPTLTIVLLAALTYTTGPVSAHRVDMMSGRRAGPVRNGETTLNRAQEWFGRADSVERVLVGCVRLERAQWNGRLVVFFAQGSSGAATETKVLRRSVRSREHGDIVVHTRKGLRIGDSRRKLRRLYPGALQYRDGGKDWYILRSSPSYGRLEAGVQRRRVVALRNGPWEYC